MRCGSALPGVLLLLASGCASTVLGPGTGESNADLGLGSVLVSSRPTDLGFGPRSGLSATAQEDIARAVDVVMARVDMGLVADKNVHVPGVTGGRAPWIARRTDARYIASRLAERVLQAGGRLAFERAQAEVVLFPWIQVLGGITTYREYRYQGYPIYLHEEDQRPTWVMVLLYDRRTKKLSVLEGDRIWQVRVDSYILGIIPLEWFLGF